MLPAPALKTPSPVRSHMMNKSQNQKELFNVATATAKLYDAGAVLLGKLATHEMAHAGPSFDLPWPPARNPWNLARFTGGSSSGSGAAVAAGMVPVALGSDTGGSIRGPASLCGVVGLMPTFGLVSRAGVITNSYTFDHCGPLARTVDDCALVLEALAGYDPKDAGSLQRPIPPYRQALGRDLRGLRIGVLRHHWEEDIPASEDVRRAMDAALDVLRRLGALLEECRVRPLGSYFDVKIIIAESEIFSVHQKNLIARLKDFKPHALGGPITVDITFKNYTPAESMAMLPGVERRTAHAIRYRAKTVLEASRFLGFVTGYRADLTP